MDNGDTSCSRCFATMMFARLWLKFRDTFGAHATTHLVPTVCAGPSTDLARLYLDDGQKTGSFQNLYRKASEREINTLWRELFWPYSRKWHEEPGQFRPHRRTVRKDTPMSGAIGP